MSKLEKAPTSEVKPATEDIEMENVDADPIEEIAVIDIV